MKPRKYLVTMRYRCEDRIVVEADNAETAIELAQDRFDSGDVDTRTYDHGPLTAVMLVTAKRKGGTK